MDAARYERLHQAFETCRGSGREVQDRLLEALRASDPDLAQRLERMLASEELRADALADEVIDRVEGQPAWIAELGLTDEPPQFIDGLRVLRQIGAGGMGVVYEAEQTAPHRRVAVKLIRSGLGHGERLRRLRLEGEALARLKHPGIAQIFASGTCDLGHGEQPYLVMELVEGQPLLLHTTDVRLDRRARLALVAELCDAVQHAHERGIVHRDLKPDNVHVDGEGRAKVLDFGVARMRGKDAALTTIHTSEGQLVGTLTHMAPEQLGGDPDAVGPAADIYALGVIAFELLTGRLPHEIAGLTLTQALRCIIEEETPRLASIDRSLRGDVDTMVGKALERAPARRYVSAAAFAADLRRYLDHRPVAARRPSLAYRTARFTRRHRGLVAGVALALVASAAGTIGVLEYAQSEAKLRDQTEWLRMDARAAGYATIEDLLANGEEWAAKEQLEQVPGPLRGWEWAWLSAQSPLQIPDREGGYAFWGETGQLITKTIGYWADLFVHDVAHLERPPRPVEGLESSCIIRGSWGRVCVGGRLLAEDDWTATPYQGATGLLDVERARFVEVIRHESVARMDVPRHPTVIREVGYSAETDTLVFATDSLRNWSDVRVLTSASSEGLRREERHQVQYEGAAGLLLDDKAELAVIFNYADNPGPVIVVRVEAWQELGRIDGPFERIPAIHPDGRELACLEREDLVGIYGLPDLERKRRLPIDPATHLDWTPDGKLVTGGFGRVALRDPETGQTLDEVRTEHPSGHFHLHPNGRLMAAKGKDRESVYVYELEAASRGPSLELRGHRGAVDACAFSPGGDLIASSSSAESEVLLWNGWTGELLARLPRAVLSAEQAARSHGDAPLIFSADGTELVTAESIGNHQVRLHRIDLVTGATSHDSPQATGGTAEAASQGAGELVDGLGAALPGGSRAAAALASAAPGRSYRVFAPSPDGSRLAVAEGAGRLDLLETENHRGIARLPTHGGDVLALTWSPDGTRLLSASDDATLRLFDSVHRISRRLQAEQREVRVAEQAERLEQLTRELGDPAAAARELCARAEDAETLQATRRACLQRWVEAAGTGAR